MRALRYALVGVVLMAASVVVYATASFPTAVKSFTTKLAGQTISAAHINDIQDEIVAIETLLLSGPLKPAAGSAAAPAYSFTANTSTGLYSSGSNAVELSTNGTKALGIDSTQFIDSPTQPRAKAFHNTTQSINNVTYTAVVFNSEDYDVGAMHDTGSATSRFTVPVGGDGLYSVKAVVNFAAIGGTSYIAGIKFRKNGTTDVTLTNGVFVGSTGNETELHLADDLVLVAGDYLEVLALQSSGGASNIGSATRVASNQMSIVKLW